MSSNLTFGIDPATDPEYAFQRIEAAYKTLLALDCDVILVVRSPGGIVLEANQECLELLGYSKNEIIGLCVSDFMSELPVAFSKTNDTDLDFHEIILHQETFWKHHNGHTVPVRVSMKKIDAPGESVYIILARDISELKEKEKELMASDERYFDLVESSGEGLGIVDTSENFTFANPAACEIFGLSAKELVGTSLNSFLDDHSIEEIKHQTSKRQEGQKSIYELEIIRRNGERRWIIVTATPQYDNNHKFISTFGIFRDITPRKLAETKLR
jgi:PAS domain S-box-containing protein